MYILKPRLFPHTKKNRDKQYFQSSPRLYLVTGRKELLFTAVERDLRLSKIYIFKSGLFGFIEVKTE